MAAIHLPRLIEDKFDDLAREVRRLWLYRGCGRVIIVALLAAAAIIILDRALTLSTPLRWAALGGWLALVLAAIWRFVVGPQRVQLTPESLACAIETTFPSLAERLISVVELSHAGDAGHGSRQLIDLLVRDTTQRTRRLPFERAAPRGPAWRAGLLASLLAILALLCPLFISGGGQQVKRFLLPWYNPATPAPFAIHVSSGSPLVKRGDSVTLTAYLERMRSDALLPTEAALITRPELGGSEKKFPMHGDGRAAFHLTYPAVAASFDYCIEAANIRSDWHRVLVVEPLELVDGTAVTITPPPYAASTLSPETLPGLPPIRALQHSELRLEVRWNRPTQEVRLEWQAENPAEPPRRIPFTLTQPQQAVVEQRLAASGHLKFTLKSEQGFTLVHQVPLAAVADQPPRFEKVAGVNRRVRQVRPDDELLLEWLVTDDIGLESLVLECTINGAAREFPLPRREPERTRSEGRFLLPLAGLVQDGDEFRYRLRASDNRAFPAAGLTPQTVYFPADSWVAVRVSPQADRLERQEITAQHEEIGRSLNAAAAQARQAQDETAELKRTLADEPMLSGEQAARLELARQQAQAAMENLNQAAAEAALAPDLAPLADALRAAADDLRTIDTALRRSELAPKPQERNALVADAEQRLAAARQTIADLQQANAALAQNRADRRKLARLAEEIERLAEQAEQAQDPAERDQLLRRLQQARDALRNLVQHNDALRRGGERAGNQRAAELAAEAERLHKAQRQVNEDVESSAAAARRQAAKPAADWQRELNRRANALRTKTAQPALQAGSQPLDSAPFDTAARKLHQGDALESVCAQEQAANQLDQLADHLERAAQARRDPREAARQLAQAQEELRKQAAAAPAPGTAPPAAASDARSSTGAGKSTASGTDVSKGTTPPHTASDARPSTGAAKSPTARTGTGAVRNTGAGPSAAASADAAAGMPTDEARLQNLLQRQQAIKQAAEHIAAPANDANAQLARARALDALNQAVEAIRQPATADQTLQQAAESLKQFADALPARGERLDIARQHFDEIMRQQQLLRVLIEEQLKRYSKRLPNVETQQELARQLADLARRQEDLADQMQALDSPGLEERRNRMAEAAHRAAADLQAGLPLDIPASQTDLRRRMDYFRMALEGRTPPDAQADELARRQRALANQLDRTPATDPAMADLRARQREIAKELKTLRAPEEAKRLAQANEAVARADQAMHADQAALPNKPMQPNTTTRADTATPADNTVQADHAQEARKAAVRDAAAALDELADHLAGIEPDAQRIERLARQQAARAAAAREQTAQPNTQEFTRQQQSELEREIEDLQGLRSGAAQAEKKAAIDQLERLRRTPNPERASALQQQAADALDQLAKKMRPERAPSPPPRAMDGIPQDDAAGQLASQADADAARSLAREQREIRDRAAQAMTEAQPDEAAVREQLERQRQLAADAAQLSRQLDSAAHAPAAGEAMARQLTEAAEAAANAQQQMEKAARNQQAGHQPESASARQQALQALEACRSSARAAAGSAAAQQEPSANAASRAASSADELLRAAAEMLARDSAASKKAMEQAAERLGEAGDRLGQAALPPPRPGQPPGGNMASRELTAADLPPDLQQYAGKPWGDLPGSVQSRIIQDLRAKYGEDYARVIKLYFEQLAEKK